MTPILVIARNTFRQTVRERTFYNLAVFGVGMLLFGMVVGSITFGFPDRVIRSIGLSGVSIALDLLALLIGVTLVHQEIDRKTLFVVLTRPVRRWQYVIGRYLGLLFTLTLSAIGLTVLLLATIVPYHGMLGPTDLMAIFASLLEASLIAALGIALSCFSTPTVSAGMGLGIWIAGATTDDLVELSAKASVVERAVANGINYLLPALARFNFREQAIYMLPVSATDALWTTLYGVTYTGLLLVIASAILSRREMT